MNVDHTQYEKGVISGINLVMADIEKSIAASNAYIKKYKDSDTAKSFVRAEQNTLQGLRHALGITKIHARVAATNKSKVMSE